jgi:hypothetical protein
LHVNAQEGLIGIVLKFVCEFMNIEVFAIKVEISIGRKVDIFLIINSQEAAREVVSGIIRDTVQS